VWPAVTAPATSYDTIIVAFSGKKDSTGCLLSLIEAGAPREHIELHHHDVDE
jgi:predicted phosphoadenosine phosphosulfate sulfurtransferase